MPKLTRKLPSYRLHKASGQEIATPPPGITPESATHGMTVNELFSAYWRFATGYYVKNGQFQ